MALGARRLHVEHRAHHATQVPREAVLAQMGPRRGPTWRVLRRDHEWWEWRGVVAKHKAGGEKDIKKGITLWEKAVAKGDEEAQENLDMLSSVSYRM